MPTGHLLHAKHLLGAGGPKHVNTHRSLPSCTGLTRSMSKYSLEETQKRGGALGRVVGLGPHRATREGSPGYETDARIGGVCVNVRRAGESSRQRTERVKTAKGQGQLQARKAWSLRAGQGEKVAPGFGGWKTDHS